MTLHATPTDVMREALTAVTSSSRARHSTIRPAVRSPAQPVQPLRQVPALQPQTRRMVDVFIGYLESEAITHVFGIVGGLLYPLFASVEAAESLTLVHVKHEEGAAFMADGFARTTGRLAVCAGTSGPGATNMLTGVACAFADGVPMLVVTGQAASHALGKGAAQEASREDIDIVEMSRPVTKYSAMVTSAETLPHHLRRALRLARSGRPGPVHLNVPVGSPGEGVERGVVRSSDVPPRVARLRPAGGPARGRGAARRGVPGHPRGLRRRRGRCPGLPARAGRPAARAGRDVAQGQGSLPRG